MWDDVQIRVSGPETAPVLIYLPGLHGDWTLIGSFKAALGESVRFVEITYPRTTSWTLTEYAARILEGVRKLGIQNGWLLAESFGAQIGWEILKQVAAVKKKGSGDRTQGSVDPGSFVPLGLITAGGFVRYPALPIVRFVRKMNAHVPMKALKWVCLGYSFYARLRHRRAPETLHGVSTFVTNRTVE